MTKEMIKTKIEDVSEMDLHELEEFGRTVSMSDVNDKAKYFLYKAIDIRKDELSTPASNIEHGEFDIREFDFE